MIIAAIDLETTGLDLKTSEIIEIAICVYDWRNNKILKQYDSLVRPTNPITNEITNITGITNQMIEDHGKHPGIVFGEIAQFLFRDKDLFKDERSPIIDYFAAHNGSKFDEIIFKRYIEGSSSFDFLKNYDWIDTAKDLPYPSSMSCKKLTHLCYEYGYIMTNAHRAIFDCYGLIHLLSKFNPDEIIELYKMPVIKVTAVVKPPWLDNEHEVSIAKKFGFTFNRDKKVWEKYIKEKFYAQFKIDCPLTIVPEQMELKECQ